MFCVLTCIELSVSRVSSSYHTDEARASTYEEKLRLAFKNKPLNDLPRDFAPWKKNLQLHFAVLV